MAFTKVGETTFVVPDDDTDFDVTLPGTVLEDDFVIYALTDDGEVTPGVVTAGYTDINTNTAGQASPGFESGYKKMGATPDTKITFNQQASGDDDAPGVLQVWRGQDLTTPEDTAPTVADAGSGMPDCPSITTVTDGALVFAIGHLDDDNVASSVTAPAGYGDLLARDPAALGTSCVMIASKVVTSFGAEDPAVFGGSGTDFWEATTFALRPAAAGLSVTLGVATEVDSALPVTPLGPIDTVEKRTSVSGIWLPLIPGVTPNAAKDVEWRWEAGWNFSGRATVTGLIVELGVATETDTAPVMAHSKALILDVATEADTAASISPERKRAINVATEVDTATVMGHFKTVPLGVATEVDTGLSIDPKRTYALGLPTEADTAPAITFSKSVSLGVASEVDTAPPIVLERSYTLGLPTETDTALPFRLPVRLGVSAEADTAPAITPRRTYAFGVVTEVDTAPPIARAKLRTLSSATEVDSALAFISNKTRTLGLPSTADTALAIVALTAKIVPIGLTTETDTAITLARKKRRTLSIPLTADTALAITANRSRTITMGLPVETDAALGLGRLKTVQLALATEVDSALLMTPDIGAPPSVAKGRLVHMLTPTRLTGVETPS